MTLTGCFTDSEITNDEEHYEADGLQLVDEKDGSLVAEVVAAGYTASANDTIILAKGDTINLEAKLLCISNGQLELCSADDHDDHEGHNHAKLIASEDDHDDHDDHDNHDDHDDGDADHDDHDDHDDGDADHDDHDDHDDGDADHDDHDDHDDGDADHDDHDDHDDHGGEALTMKISLSDSTSVGITESDSELYHIGLEGLKVGKSTLSVEFWHGSHIDIEAKEFVVIVE